MSDFKRDTTEAAARWTALEKDLAAIYAEQIKFLSSGILEFGKITVQSLIYINAGALTITPAIVKIVSEGSTLEFKYFFLALGSFVLGLIFALICSYTSYIQYNFDLAAEIGLKDRNIEFFKSTKEIHESVSFIRFDHSRYEELNKYIDKNRKNSSKIVHIVQFSGWTSALSFVAGSLFAASHVLKIDFFRLLGF